MQSLFHVYNHRHADAHGFIRREIDIRDILRTLLTGGRASFIMKFASYELVPSDVQDKLIKEFEAKQAEE